MTEPSAYGAQRVPSYHNGQPVDTSMFIARRISRNRARSFSRTIIRLSIGATTISVAAMILSLAFINGFQQVISDKIFSFWGHLRIQHFEPYKVNTAEETPIIREDSVEDRIRAGENTAHLSPFATKSAVLNAHGTIEGILFKGVDDSYPFIRLNGFLKAGRWPDLRDTLYGKEIVISQTLADALTLKVGEDVVIYFIKPGEERPRTRKLKVCGIFRTGIDIYDRTFALGDIRLLQRLNDWQADQIGGYEVVLKDHQTLDASAEQIFPMLPGGWDSRTMMQIHPEIFDWLNLQNTNKYILITVMTLVALINLITCLIILVLERTRMIGVLKALGMGDWDIQRIFLGYGSLILVWGIGLGSLLGLGIAWLQLYTGFIRLDETAYYMDRAPILVVWWQVGAVMAGTFLTCVLVLTIPTIISRRIQPSKAVQFR
jgi:lipoprotein-releasing system permease protein